MNEYLQIIKLIFPLRGKKRESCFILKVRGVELSRERNVLINRKKKYSERWRGIPVFKTMFSFVRDLRSNLHILKFLLTYNNSSNKSDALFLLPRNPTLRCSLHNILKSPNTIIEIKLIFTLNFAKHYSGTLAFFFSLKINFSYISQYDPFWFMEEQLTLCTDFAICYFSYDIHQIE